MVVLLLDAARFFLVIGAAIPVVDAVTKGGGVVFAHVGIAAQNVLLAAFSASRIGAGPRRTELAGRLVLICEEGLVPPINTIV
jgi:hypothetical protein